MHLWFPHVFFWLDSSFLALNNIPLSGCTKVHLSIHLLKDRPPGCFQVLVIVNKAAIVYIHPTLNMPDLVWSWKLSRVRPALLLGWRPPSNKAAINILVQVFCIYKFATHLVHTKEHVAGKSAFTVKCLPKQLYHCALPPARLRFPPSAPCPHQHLIGSVFWILATLIDM